ncbi:MAG: hypothetical protein ASARMPRED_003895 [Alectoria sarmentosa]|nr:MAG: hypothetical protein ASARMPRED_003895 [Alectoria sarmentosa]
MSTVASIYSGFGEMTAGEDGNNQRKLRQRPTRTYVYKHTVDDGVAPCAPPAEGNLPAFLTLAVCKSAIRRTAKPGDRILGITSKAIADTDSYPMDSIIYFAVVDEVIPSQNYFTTAHQNRLDCIYSFDKPTGDYTRLTTTDIHDSQKDREKDLGKYPLYKNGWVLVCREFRYFGKDAVTIPSSTRLFDVSQSLRQGHRVYDEEDKIWHELEGLINDLRVTTTSFTPKTLAGNTRRSVLK